jgi:hypothetical protein
VLRKCVCLAFVAVAAAAVVVSSPGVARAASQLSISEDSYDYGSHPLTTETSHHFTITNNGGDATTLTSQTVNNFSEFLVRNDTCFTSDPLPAGGTCEFDVVFKPNTLGVRNGSVIYNYDSGGITLNLTGTGTLDTTPPVLLLPEPITVAATSPAGAVVTYAATATDDVDGSVPVTCNPPSGSSFSIGTTTVTCTATDNQGNVASGTFTVRVKGAVELLGELVAASDGSGPDGSLASISSKAIAAAEDGRTVSACNILHAYLNEVSAQRSKTLANQQADDLTALVLSILDALDC